jgi:hypothetical protein
VTDSEKLTEIWAELVKMNVALRMLVHLGDSEHIRLAEVVNRQREVDTAVRKQGAS